MNQPMRYPTKPESIITTDDEVARLRQLEAVLVHCNTHGLVPPLSTEHQANVMSEYRRTAQADAVEYAAGRKQVQASPGAQAELLWLAAAIRRGEVEI